MPVAVEVPRCSRDPVLKPEETSHFCEHPSHKDLNMTDPPSYDSHLLDRLNALKKSSITLEPSNPQLSKTKSSTPEQDLSARLRSLRTASVSSSLAPASSSRAASQPKPEPKDETLPFCPPIPASNPLDHDDPLRNPHILKTDDKTLDELLAELGPEDQWTLDDPKDIQRLLDEARTALPNEDTQSASRSSVYETSKKTESNSLTRDLDMSVFSTDDHDESEHEDNGDSALKPAKEERLTAESREAENIIARAMDEAKFEKDSEPSQTINEGLALPSTPSTHPEPTTGSDSDFAFSISARMAALRVSSSPSSATSSPFPSAPTTIPTSNALGLPSAPTFAPATKPLPTLQKKVAFTDADIDGWCIICQDDAGVKCIGCDGDLYCAMCWKEGHMGLDVGWEEKRHKWVKWRKTS